MSRAADRTQPCHFAGRRSQQGVLHLLRQRGSTSAKNEHWYLLAPQAVLCTLGTAACRMHGRPDSQKQLTTCALAMRRAPFGVGWASANFTAGVRRSPQWLQGSLISPGTCCAAGCPDTVPQTAEGTAGSVQTAPQVARCSPGSTDRTWVADQLRPPADPSRFQRQLKFVTNLPPTTAALSLVR